MIVVSDTSCVSNLLTIGHSGLLRELFGDIIVPPAVERELRRFHTNIAFPFVVREPVDTPLLKKLFSELDAGEAEAISLAVDLKADRLLIDEQAGRKVAVREGLAIVGVVGVLIAAKQKGLVESIKPLLMRLQDEAGFRLSATVQKAALEAVGESVS